MLVTRPGANTVIKAGDNVALDVSSGPEPDYFLLRTGSTECLEVGSDPSGEAWPEVSARSPCTSTARQQWTYVQVGNGRFLLKNKGNGLCLDVPFNDQRNSIRLITADCHGAAWQQWHNGGSDHGGHQIVSASSGKCVDKAGDTVVQYGCHSGWWQFWAEDPV